jgi:hypothetical protein
MSERRLPLRRKTLIFQSGPNLTERLRQKPSYSKIVRYTN